MLSRLKQKLLRKVRDSAHDHEAPSQNPGILVNAYCTRAVVPDPAFPHRPCGKREMPSAEMGQHLKGFEGYVMSRGSPQMTRTKYDVVRHIQRTRRRVSGCYCYRLF